MYPIDVFPLEATIVGVAVLSLLGFWVAHEDDSARPLGLVSLPIVAVTGWCWFDSMPEWTAWVIAIATALVFIYGMLSDESKDDRWHYGALFLALFGKLLIWTVPLIWDVLTGEVEVKLQGWMILILVLGIAIGVALGFSDRFRNRLRGWLPSSRPTAASAPVT